MIDSIEIKNLENSEALYVYLKNNNESKINFLTKGVDPVCKKALIDTETNVVKCTTEGNNCKVAAVTNKIPNNLDYLTLFDNSFPDENIFLANNSQLYINIYKNGLQLNIPESFISSSVIVLAIG